MESGNVLITDHISDGYAVDLDSVSDRVEQVLSLLLLSVLHISREVVEHGLVRVEDPLEVCCELPEDDFAVRPNILLRLLDLSEIGEVDGDFDWGLLLHDLRGGSPHQVVILEHSELIGQVFHVLTHAHVSIPITAFIFANWLKVFLASLILIKACGVFIIPKLACVNARFFCKLSLFLLAHTITAVAFGPPAINIFFELAEFFFNLFR